MNTTNHQSVKARFSFNGHIFFSYTKLSFQKNLFSFAVPVILIPILIISNSLNLYCAHRDEANYEMFFFLSILVISLVLTIVTIFKYKETKTMDGKEFSFREIKMIRIRESRTNAKLAFEFTNGVKHKMSIKKDDAYSNFFKNLTYANVTISTTKN
ncbi:hypothetical protein QUH73_00190 [Labilibaculum sp. K2S]|uniref:hypothetical protein n=1 Tax=Labilibaculum sp. K2S TaxID=3056386 RepID=UPI0025A3C2F5|nr:hypothetical protein [Labilibaculum sp. K2S]MDM8158219.1 hypothetical protein [Labilibaculum sp. K2S]